MLVKIVIGLSLSALLFGLLLTAVGLRVLWAQHLTKKSLDAFDTPAP